MVTPKVSVRFVTHERVQETTYAIFAGGIQRASAIGCLHVRNAIEAEHGKVEFGGAIKIDDGNREPIDCADRENRCRRPAELSDRYEEDLWGCLDALLRAVQEENGLRTIAPCETFHFNCQSSNGRACGLTGENLSDVDVQRVRLELAYPHC